MCVGLQEHPGGDAVLLRGVERLQFLQALVDAQVMRVLVLEAVVMETVRSGLRRTVRLGGPEQVRVSDGSGSAAVSDWLSGQWDLARCRVTELRCRTFRRREMDELPLSKCRHWNTKMHMVSHIDLLSFFL